MPKRPLTALCRCAAFAVLVAAAALLPSFAGAQSEIARTVNALTVPGEIAFPSRKPVVIPFEWDGPRHRMMLVKARLNGLSRPLTFVLDTGTSTPFVITSGAARDCGLKDTGEEAAVEGASATVRSFSGGILELMDARGSTRLTVSVPGFFVLSSDKILTDGEVTKIDGILGAPFARNARTRFDFANRTLTLYPEGASLPKADPARSATLPLKGDSLDATYFIPEIRVTVPAERTTGGRDKQATVLIDTGAGFGVLHAPDFDEPGTLELKGSVYPGSITTIQGDDPVMTARLPLLYLGTLAETHADFDVVPDQSKSQSSLGLNFLLRFVVTFDYQARTVTFERARDYAKLSQWEWGAPNLSFRLQGADWVIDKVTAGSPPAEAGLKVGDVVRRVDGVSIPAGKDAPSPEYVGRLANGVAGERARIAVLREGKPAEVTYTREGYFGSGKPSGNGDGSINWSSDTRTFTMTGIMPGSTSYRAGLRDGDQILALNGKSVKELDPREFFTLFDQAAGSGRFVLTVLSAATPNDPAPKPHDVHVVKPAEKSDSGHG